VKPNLHALLDSQFLALERFRLKERVLEGEIEREGKGREGKSAPTKSMHFRHVVFASRILYT
jgi:hypothetical protein